MLAEALEPAVPRLGVGPEPVVDLLEWRRVELVEALAALPPDPDEPGGAERVEVLGHGLAGDGQIGRERRDRQTVTPAKPLHQQAAGRIGDGVEDGFHLVNMQPYSCICQARDTSVEVRAGGYDAAMRLTPWEEERLLIFAAAELARRHRAAGIALNAPEAIALICDAMLEAARAGATYDAIEAAGRSAVDLAEVLDGVPALVDQVALEVLMDDGTRLVVLVDPLGAADDGPGAIRRATVTPASDARDRRSLEVRSESARVIRVSSHHPFERVNRRLVFDRDAAAGFHLDLPAGSTERWAPGETKTVRLVRYDDEAER